MNTTSVFERFESIASRYSGKVAFQDIDAEYTYSELYSGALVVRSNLNQLNNDKSGIVALFFNDRYKAVTAILGVTGSIHAYIPLDPNDADERLSYILKDSGAFAVITEEALLDKANLLFSDNCRVINFDKLPELPDVVSTVKQHQELMLYTLYTSGSTGKPKGVCQTHSNLLFYIDTYIEKLKISTGDRITWLYNYSVSASNMDIYGAMLSGATLCSLDIYRYGTLALTTWLNEKRISILHTAPTILRELTRSLSPNDYFPSIRVVDLAGETLYREDIASLIQHIPASSEVFNRLAATEICFVAQHKIELGDSTSPNEVLPVGKCPDNVKIEIVLENGQPLPTGETGFITIHSLYICSGYLNRSDLDALSFDTSPHAPDWRVYKTTDLGKVDSNGNLHFLGREGTRIKLHGYSVDLSEVESALRSCSEINEAVIIPNSHHDGEVHELIACISLKPETSANLSSIRKQLFRLLPSFMLPSGYILLEKLPRTISGKVNRQALINLDLQKNRYRPDYIAPIDETEKRIATIFSAVLQFEPISRLDDFFLIGGDSLNLVNLQLMLRSQFGVEVMDIHKNSTVESIASYIRQAITGIPTKMPLLVPLQLNGNAPALFLVHGRRGQAHVGKNFVSILGDSQPCFAIQAKGLDGLCAPNLTVIDMANDYVEAIFAQQAEGPYFIGSLCAGAYVAVEMARILKQKGAKVLPLLLIDPPAPHFNKSGVLLQETDLISHIHEKVKIGDWNINTDSNKAIKGAIDVARAFQNALLNYQVKTTYDGAVYLISSKARLSNLKWLSKAALYHKLSRALSVLRLLPSNKRVKRKWTRKELSHTFGNNVSIFSVGGAHNELLDVNNIEFKTQLTHCLHLILNQADKS